MRDVEAITLLGYGFGEIIRPVSPKSGLCAHWGTLPTGQYYLAASTSDLETIMSIYGTLHSQPMKLSDNRAWYHQQNSYEPIAVDKVLLPTGEDTAIGFQLLVPQKLRNCFIKVSNPCGSMKSAAVVSGHSPRFKLFFRDFGDLELGWIRGKSIH